MPTVSKQRAGAGRQVVCTHCEKPCEVGQRAMSIFCPHCRKRLILEDFKITGYHGVREFATCGDVIVEKNGNVAALVKVGALTVKGKVQGNVIARDRVKIHKTGWLHGDIKAPVLCVESGAKLNGYLCIGQPKPKAPKTRRRKKT
jgi:hypothetical protein